MFTKVRGGIYKYPKGIFIKVRGDIYKYPRRYSLRLVGISINIRGEIRRYELTHCTRAAVGEFVPPLSGDVGPELFIDTRGDMYRYLWRHL